MKNGVKFLCSVPFYRLFCNLDMSVFEKRLCLAYQYGWWNFDYLIGFSNSKQLNFSYIIAGSVDIYVF